MEKSGVLVSARNINPLSAVSRSEVQLQFNSFPFKSLPLCRFQFSLDKLNCASRRSSGRNARSRNTARCSTSAPPVAPYIELSLSHEIAQPLVVGVPDDTARSFSELVQNMVLLDLDPATAKLAIAFLGPFLSVFGFLFVLRIVMSWYPKLPVGKFPYVLAYAPTEPILGPTRKVIPPLGGVDVTPVVWFGLISFLNEILVGPQGLLVLLSQQV